MKNAITQSTERLLTETEAAELLGFSKNTLRTWRVSGRPGGYPPPPYKKIGRAVRYPLSILQAWIAKQATHQTTSDEGVRDGV